MQSSEFRSRKTTSAVGLSSAASRSDRLAPDNASTTNSGVRRRHSTFKVPCASLRSLTPLSSYATVFTLGFFSAFILVFVFFKDFIFVETQPPKLSSAKSAAYSPPLVDASQLQPILTYGSKPQRDWVGSFYKKHTGFVRTAAVSHWLSDYLRFEDSGPPYDSVQCVTSFAGLIDFTEDKGHEYNAAILRYLNRHSLHNAKGQHKYTVRSKIDDSNNGGLPALNGQFGMMAKNDLEKYECVGQYIGDEMFVDEFNAIYEWKAVENEKHFAKKWYYFLTIQEEWHLAAALKLHRSDSQLLAAGVDTSNDTLLRNALVKRYGSNRTFTIDGYLDAETEAAKSHIKRQLEAGDELSMCLVAFVNDARVNMSSAELSQTDIDERLNTEFVNCVVNGGGVFPFLVTLKHIANGKQLFNYYGPNYVL